MQITRKNRNRTKYRNKNRRYFSKKNIKHTPPQYGGAEIVNDPLNSIQAASDQVNQQFRTGANNINNRIQSATNRIQSATNRIQSGTNYANNTLQSAANAKEALKNDIADLSNMKNKIKPLFQSIIQSRTSEPIVPKEGILDIASDSLSNAVANASDFVGDKLLRLIGLQPINADNTNSSEQQNNPLDQPINIASRIASKVLNIANNKFGNILQKLNTFLDSPETQMNIAEAGKNLVDKFILLLKQFNETLDNPILKEEFVLAVYILGVYTKIFVDSTEKPLDKAIDLLNQAIIKATSGLSTGAVKVVMDVVGAVPIAGEIVDFARALNDGSKAAMSTFNAGVNAVEAGSVLLGETSQNLNDAFQSIKEKQQESSNITQRTNDSIQNFENNPLNKNKAITTGGSKKTRTKSKRNAI